MMQEAAALESDERGYGMKDVAEKGVVWILAGWRMTYLERLGWRAPVEVRTWPRQVAGFASEREFVVYSGERLAAKGSSRWFLVDAHTGKITRVTPAVRAAYEMNPEAVFDEPLRTNGKSPANAVPAFSTTAGRRDIDTNGHVNNIHYLDYALEALPAAVADSLPGTVEIVFRHQLLPGTNFQCLYSQTEGQHLVEIRSGAGDNVVHHAYVWFY